MTVVADCALIGRWRIVEADLWDRAYLDFVEPACIAFNADRHGEFVFGCVQGGLDLEYAKTLIFFTWQGFDEMGEVSGDGSAELEDNGDIEIELRFHHGDEAILKAKKWCVFQQPVNSLSETDRERRGHPGLHPRRRLLRADRRQPPCGSRHRRSSGRNR